MLEMVFIVGRKKKNHDSISLSQPICDTIVPFVGCQHILSHFTVELIRTSRLVKDNTE